MLKSVWLLGSVYKLDLATVMGFIPNLIHLLRGMLLCFSSALKYTQNDAIRLDCALESMLSLLLTIWILSNCNWFTAQKLYGNTV